MVALLEAVRAEHVTKHNKDDLDAIQTMVKNIAYREAGEQDRVQKVHFTEVQKIIIRQVTGMTHKSVAKFDEALSKVGGHKLTYPHEQLHLEPTRPSMLPPNGARKKSASKNSLSKGGQSMGQDTSQ